MTAIRLAILCAVLSMAATRELAADEPTNIVSILRKPTLQSIVHRGVMDDPDILNISWHRSGDNCYFTLGRIVEAMDDSPSKRAIRTHLVAEFFARTKQAADESWAKDIQELRAAANREHQRVEREEFVPDEGSIVPEVESLVREMFDRLAQAEGADAALNEMLSGNEADQNGPKVPLPREFPVSVPGTRIYCVTPFRYQLLAAFEQLSDQEQWGEVVDTTDLSEADFYFWIVKPDGTKTRTGKVHLGKEKVIQLPGA